MMFLRYLMSKLVTNVKYIVVFLFLNFVILNFAFSRAWTSDVELLVWQSTSTAPKIILPKLVNESPEEAISRYLKAIGTDPDLTRLSQDSLSYEVYSAEIKNDFNESTRPSLIFLANTFEDMSPEGERIQRNIKTFSRAGANPYVLGIAADIGLTEEQAEEFRTLIAMKFNLMVALGGDDISAELSGRQQRENSKTVLKRDISELKIIKIFKDVGMGVFFGICRGHQMGAIADGHVVVEDLSASGVGHTRDHIDKSGANITSKQTWHHIYVEEGSLLARLWGIKDGRKGLVITVNSLHHQVVLERLNAMSAAVAWHETSGVEALQMFNGLGISTQYHPEFPAEISGNAEYSAEGFRLIRNIVAYSRLIKIRKAKPQVCELFLVN